MLKHIKLDLCIDSDFIRSLEGVGVGLCDTEKASQRWKFQVFSDNQRK